MMAWLRKWRWALEDEAFSWFQLRCRHQGEWVRADILEAGWPVEVQWCGRCGAYRHAKNGQPTSVWRPAPGARARDL
jgi:hypothetical protein